MKESSLSELDTAWLAGVMEGEGCFQLRRARDVQVYFASTDLDVVERVSSLFGGTHIGEQKRYSEKHNRLYRTSVCSDRAIAVLQQILPHMGARRTTQIAKLIEART